MNKGTGSFTVWENTMCNPLAPAREQARLAWHDGYASAEQTPDYERGFVDGMQKQMQSSVDKAVNAMAKRQWVGLTDEEIHNTEGYQEDRALFRFAQAIEAKLKEKNT